MKKNEFKTTNNLDFQVGDFNSPITGDRKDVKRFKIGTCVGLWSVTHDGYEIHSVNNLEKGNGNLDDVFEWFEFSTKRDKGILTVIDVTGRFKKHLIEKRGFTQSEYSKNNVEKSF